MKPLILCFKCFFYLLLLEEVSGVGDIFLFGAMASFFFSFTGVALLNDFRVFRFTFVFDGLCSCSCSDV